MDVLIWIGIVFCLSQSAILSGSNLAFFSVSKLKLEIEARQNKHAALVHSLRQDANFLLATILWGNVAVNVLLALLSDSVLAGVLAFMFSTVVITIFGEIMPQAYFSRNALKTAFYLSPIIRVYQILLYPVAKATAKILDLWLGKEAILYFKERDIRGLLKLHMISPQTEIDYIEGQGALNFLDIDDVPLSKEGAEIAPESIVTLPFVGDKPVFPAIQPLKTDEFLQQINRSGRKWVVIVDESGSPRLALNSGDFIRGALFDNDLFDPCRYCHQPIIVDEDTTPVGQALSRLQLNATPNGYDVVHKDVILLWGKHKRIITGADILGRLLQGVAQNAVAGS